MACIMVSVDIRGGQPSVMELSEGMDPIIQDYEGIPFHYH